MKRYIYNKDRIYIGSSDFDEMCQMPPMSTCVAPPTVDEGFAAKWNGTSWDVVSTVRTPEEIEAELELHKARKKEHVQAEKKAKLDSGFYSDGVKYDSDLAARVAFQELAQTLSEDPTYSTDDWKTADGTFVTMNKLRYDHLKIDGAAHIAACFAWQAAKNAEIDACTTLAQVCAVSTVYGE